MIDQIIALTAYRRENNLGYWRLACRIRELTGYRVNAQTLHNILHSKHKPTQETRLKIEAFLTAVKTSQKKVSASDPTELAVA
jgi:hypothetical protein